MYAHKCLWFPAVQYLQVRVANTPGKKLEHQGIKVQLLGQIELKTERGSPNDFLALGRHCMLAAPHVTSICGRIFVLMRQPHPYVQLIHNQGLH